MGSEIEEEKSSTGMGRGFNPKLWEGWKPPKKLSDEEFAEKLAAGHC